MNTKPTEDEFGLAVQELGSTLKAFDKAAKRLMSIMDSMNKKRNQELEALPGNSKQTHEFLVQIMDDSGQIGENCFGIRCVAEKEKKQEDWPTITAMIVDFWKAGKLSITKINL